MPAASATVASAPIAGGSAEAARRPAASAGSSGSVAARRIDGAGSAGVELYARAANIAVQQDSVNTSVKRERELKKKVEPPRTNPSAPRLARTWRRSATPRRVNQEAQAALLGRLDDAQFVAGFGSNGGEEFLSYMNISESLVVKGGRDWKRWDDAMTGNLGRIQNSDGSWSGHHCITGRTFCTSTALLVLMADRSPVPVPVAAEATAK